MITEVKVANAALGTGWGGWLISKSIDALPLIQAGAGLFAALASILAIIVYWRQLRKQQ